MIHKISCCAVQVIYNTFVLEQDDSNKEVRHYETEREKNQEILYVQNIVDIMPDAKGVQENEGIHKIHGKIKLTAHHILKCLQALNWYSFGKSKIRTFRH